MAWPFSSVAAPNKDSGFMAVPTAAANPTNFDGVTVYWLVGAHFANSGDQDGFVTVTDGSDAVILPAIRVPAHQTLPPLDWTFLPTTGVKWSMSGSGPGGAVITGKIWGYA